jgi:hypothetical protein
VITPNAVYKDAVRPCKTCPPVVHGQIFGAGRPNTHVNLYRYNQSTHAEFNMPMTARILPPENLRSTMPYPSGKSPIVPFARARDAAPPSHRLKR